MCGRYTNDAELSDIRLAFDVEQLELYREWKPSYNITPSYGSGTEQLIVVRTKNGARALRLGRFWFIPRGFDRPLKELPTTFNARAEEIANKPLFREAFASRRCLVPATGWREFKGPAGHKQPFHFHLGRRLFAFAGIWSEWVSPDGEAVASFAIVTTEPSPLAATVHDRMPLVLGPEHYTAWLGTGPGDGVLAAARAESLSLPLEVYASDPIGNSGRFEGPEVLAPVTLDEKAPPAQGELFAAAITGTPVRAPDRRSPAGARRTPRHRG